jgi:hypothetical protein
MIPLEKFDYEHFPVVPTTKHLPLLRELKAGTKFAHDCRKCYPYYRERNHLTKILDSEQSTGTDFCKKKREPATRFSTSGFFHQTTPPWPLRHGLKPFFNMD